MVPERREKHLQFCDFNKSELNFVDSRYDPAMMFEREEEQSTRTFKLNHFFNQLSAKEQTLVKLRYGIGYIHPYSVAQCSELMHVSLENVRIMESHALIKMQDNAKRMFDYDAK